MAELVVLNATFVCLRPKGPKKVREMLAQMCCTLFDEYHKNIGEAQKEIGRELLVAVTNFLQADNLVRGQPEEKGIASHRYLMILRKVLAIDELSAIPPLPQEVYAALP